MIISSLLLLAAAQAPASYPLLDQLSTKLVQKYQTSTCAQLAAEKAAPPSGQQDAIKQRLSQQLQQNAQMRADFVSKVAGPIVDKMIVCGMVP